MKTGRRHVTGPKAPVIASIEYRKRICTYCGSPRIPDSRRPVQSPLPTYKVDSNTVTRDLSQIRKEKELASGVYEVRTNSDKDLYVYKEVDRPLYEPRDSEVLEQELRNLERFRGIKVVVQLLAAVITEVLHQRASRGLHVSVRHDLPMPQDLQSVPFSIPSFHGECTRDTGKAVKIGFC
jgi:hypothetical protein